MSSLSLPNNDYAPSTLILSAEVVADFTAVVNKINGNLHYDNLGVMTGAIVWALSSNVSAISIATSSNITAVDVNHTTTALATTRHLIHARSSATNIAADAALVKVEQNGASSTEPAVEVSNSGLGATAEFNSTTRGITIPRMTTAQRQTATATSVAGDQIYHTDLKRMETFDGTYWKASNSGEFIWLPEAASTFRPDAVYCDGSTLANNHLNAFARAFLSSWGGVGVLPDMRRKTVAGDGGVATAGPAATLAATGGAETQEAHTHAFGTLAAANESAHTHTGTTVGVSSNHRHSYPASAEGGGSGGDGTSDSAYGSETATSGNGYLLNGGTNGGTPGDIKSSIESADHTHGFSTSAGSAHTHTLSGSTASTGTGTGQGNWQPTVIMKPYLVL